MATYFVNASGSNTAPYDTPAKGRTSLASLFSNITEQAGDIIEVVYGTYSEGGFTINAAVTIRSYGTDGSNRSEYKPTISIAGINYTTSLTIYDIIFNCTGANGIYTYTATPINLLIERCSFSRSSLTTDNYGIRHSDSPNSSVIVKNSIFKYFNVAIFSNTGGQPSTGKIVNCTFYDCSTDWNQACINAHNGASFLVANCIFQGMGRTNQTCFYSSSASISSDYNCIYNFPSGVYGSHRISSNPLLTDPVNNVFTISQSSPCLDTGTSPLAYSDIPTNDYIGRSRPMNSSFDIGAYEMYYAVNTFSSPTIPVNESVSSTANKKSIVDLVQASHPDTYFDSTSEIKNTLVTYRHSSGRQRKTISYSGANLTGNVMWTDMAQDGTWQKWFVQVIGSDGVQSTLSRAQIGTQEDIIKSDGTVYLNI